VLPDWLTANHPNWIGAWYDMQVITGDASNKSSKGSLV
jgi:hypothetical protein